jgi:hypothetical protein
MAVLPDVLLLPGLLCDQRLWAAQVEGLAGQITPLEAPQAVTDALRDWLQAATA